MFGGSTVREGPRLVQDHKEPTFKKIQRKRKTPIKKHEYGMRDWELKTGELERTYPKEGGKLEKTSET